MACTIRHPNIKALKASVYEHWDTMAEDYICNSGRAFKGHQEAIISAMEAILMIKTPKVWNLMVSKLVVI